MHNITPHQLKRYARQLLSATEHADWQQIQQLDKELRPLLKQCQQMQLSPLLQQEMTYLKGCHQQAYTTLSDARDRLNEQLKSFTETKERNLAYQMTMNLE
ncbi:hypothetical protein DI392_11935 [Vibrio albus]|uniref:LafD n=1 Tax=Vibrio albus TaxID=2200953 RepID=A0A2U3B8F1_9VIBR|nr:hypothetical protein [Vibrio albus]PWI33015.1 hypothetical protein DI392_11935 [Vibrio albus]